MRFWARTRAAARRSAPQDDATDGPDPAGADGNGAAGATPAEGVPIAPVPVPVATVIVPRWVQIVLLPLSLLALWALARAAGSVLLILIVAGVIALVLAPVVSLLSRRLPRGVAILLVYLGGFATVGGIVVLLANPVSTQVSRFSDNLPAITRSATRDLGNVQRWLDRNGIHVHIEQQGQSALDTLQKEIKKRSSDIVSFAKGLLTSVVTIGFDLVLILVLSVYLLVYGREIGALVRGLMPPGDGTPQDDYPLLVQHAVSGYIRGQLLFSLIMGSSAALILAVFGLLGVFPDGEHYALFFGAFYGLMEFIPYIGPIIGPLPAIVLALVQDPIWAVWLVVLFIALQQLEGHVVAPQVFRISLRINPILIILSLLIGDQIYGIVGSLIALPVIAVLRQTVLYLRRHLVLEPWGTAGGGLGLLTVDPDRCPECGAPATVHDLRCRVCGASLEPRVRSSS